MCSISAPNSAPSFIFWWGVERCCWEKKQTWLPGTVNLRECKGNNVSVSLLISKWEVWRETCFCIL